jgi:hypothetical protein
VEWNGEIAEPKIGSKIESKIEDPAARRYFGFAGNIGNCRLPPYSPFGAPLGGKSSLPQSMWLFCYTIFAPGCGYLEPSAGPAHLILGRPGWKSPHA